jgi:NADH:ubiquinone oxidoreductase subunit C
MSDASIEKTAKLANDLKAKFGDLLSEICEFRGECTLVINDKQKIAEVCHYAKSELAFDCLTDLSGVDHLGEEPRFSVVYELYGLRPVEVGDALVSRATLHNIEYIRSLGLEIGCQVEVIRSGEIIPRIVRRVDIEKNSS